MHGVGEVLDSPCVDESNKSEIRISPLSENMPSARFIVLRIAATIQIWIKYVFRDIIPIPSERSAKSAARDFRGRYPFFPRAEPARRLVYDFTISDTHAAAAAVTYGTHSVVVVYPPTFYLLFYFFAPVRLCVMFSHRSLYSATRSFRIYNMRVYIRSTLYPRNLRRGIYNMIFKVSAQP